MALKKVHGLIERIYCLIDGSTEIYKLPHTLFDLFGAGIGERDPLPASDKQTVCYRKVHPRSICGFFTENVKYRLDGKHGRCPGISQLTDIIIEGKKFHFRIFIYFFEKFPDLAVNGYCCDGCVKSVLHHIGHLFPAGSPFYFNLFTQYFKFVHLFGTSVIFSRF